MRGIYMPRDDSHEEYVKHILSCPAPDDPYWQRVFLRRLAIWAVFAVALCVAVLVLS